MKRFCFFLIFSLALSFLPSDSFGEVRTITIVNTPTTTSALKVFRLQNGKLFDISQNTFGRSRFDTPILKIDSKDNILLSFIHRSGRESHIKVMKFDGRKWALLGEPVKDSGSGYYDFSVDRLDTPFIIFEDTEHTSKLTAMQYTEKKWQVVGKRGFTSHRNAKAMKLSFDIKNQLNVLYGYFDFKNNQYPVKVIVFNGKNWVEDQNFKYRISNRHSPIIKDYVFSPSGTHYFSFGFQSGRDKPGIKILKYTLSGKPDIVIDQKKADNFDPSLQVCGNGNVFVLCGSIEKNLRKLDLLEVSGKKLVAVKQAPQSKMIYFRRSNLALSPSGKLGFVFARKMPDDSVSIVYMSLKNGTLFRKAEYAFDKAIGIGQLYLLFDSNDIPCIALVTT